MAISSFGKQIFAPKLLAKHQEILRGPHPISYSCKNLREMELFNENFPYFALTDHLTVRCEVLKSNTIELVLSPQTAKVLTCYYDEKGKIDFEIYFHELLARIKHFDHTCWLGKIEESDRKTIYSLLQNGIHHLKNLMDEFNKKKNFDKNIWIRGERGKYFADFKADEIFFIQ